MKVRRFPKDLQKHIKTYIFKKIALFSLMEAALIAVLILWGDTLFGSSTGVVLYVLWVLLLLVPFFVTKIPFSLLDKTYFGVIEQVQVKTSIENERPFKPTLEGHYTAVTVSLVVKEEESDKRHTVKVRRKGSATDKNGMFDTYAVEGESFVKTAENAYKVGAKVFHLYGTKHIVVLPDDKAQSVCCAVCGESNSVKEDVCRKCGHTLIK